MGAAVSLFRVWLAVLPFPGLHCLSSFFHGVVVLAQPLALHSDAGLPPLLASITPVDVGWVFGTLLGCTPATAGV